MADVTDDPPEVRKTRQEWADALLADDLVQATADLDGRFKELEERIRQLEARPYPIIQPYPMPTWPASPPSYPFYPVVWCSSDRTA